MGGVKRIVGVRMCGTLTMKTFHHIIAAVDFTPSCLRALREAARRASLDHASITAVHVMDEFLVHELKTALSTTEAAVRAEWEAKLRKFVDSSGAGGAIIKAEVRVGHPYVELVEACHTHGADLLVMGSKGSDTGVHHVGAIAAKCIRKAPVDVLIVRSDVETPFKRIVACVDLSENSAKAVQCAVHVGKQDGAAVDCVHVYQSALAMALDYGGFVTPMPPVVTDEEAIKSWQSELQRFLEPLLRQTEGMNVQQHVVEQINVRDAIIDYVTEQKADLVVLGTRGKGALRHMLIGTTAEKIVQRAPCSILAVKPDDVVASADG